MKRLILFSLMLSMLFVGSCARRDMLIAPGRLNMSSAAGQPTDKWTFWVRSVVDSRSSEFAGKPRIGHLGQRFDEADTTVHLDALPDQYLKEQLKLFLLNTGLEASEEQKAKVFLDVNLFVFKLEADTTSVLDKLDFDLDFEVKFYAAADGRYLGAVRLPEQRWIKHFSPFGSNKDSLELLVRDTVSSTFGLLAQADVFKTAAEIK